MKEELARILREAAEKLDKLVDDRSGDWPKAGEAVLLSTGQKGIALESGIDKDNRVLVLHNGVPYRFHLSTVSRIEQPKMGVLKRGDRVVVLDGGEWRGWVGPMNEFVGRETEIVQVDYENGVCIIDIDTESASRRWSFPLWALERV